MNSKGLIGLRVTIKDIADRVGVSVTTVSRVLNDRPDVSKHTKEKILRVVAELDFNPSSMARGLVLQRTYTIGLIIPDICNPFFAEVARGIQRHAQDRGYSVVFCTTDNDEARESQAIELLRSKQVDGMMVSLSVHSHDNMARLHGSDFPIVQIDRKVPFSPYPAVVIDNVSSAYTATNYLMSLGFERIAHITGDMNTQTGQDRLCGYEKALKEKGVAVREDYVVCGDYNKESGRLQMDQLLNRVPTPLAVFIANDLMAIGALEAIKDRGLLVPSQIALIGHDNIDVSTLLRPSLTTMAQPKLQMGEIAADMLIQWIEGESIPSGDTVLTTELILRESALLLEEGEH